MRAGSFLVDLLVVLAIFATYAATPPPDVNEAHYLTKAKHYWDRSFAPGDLFLDSSHAHLAFYFSFGWIAQWVDLDSFAWIGRILVWCGLACAWTDLMRAVTGRFGAAPLAALVWLTVLHFGHLSGEWVVGGLEAKSVAFIFVFAGLGRFVRGNFFACWIWWGLAACFHVLVGGWTIVAALLALLFRWRREPAHGNHYDWRLLLGLVLGALVSLLGVLPMLGLEQGVPAEQLAAAHRAYVYERLPHHLVFSSFHPHRMAAFLSVLVLWLVRLGTTRRDVALGRLDALALGTLPLLITGVLIDQIARSSGDWNWGAAWLRYYWFRAADVFVTLTMALGWIAPWLSLWQSPLRRDTTLLSTAVASAAALLIGYTAAVWEQHGDGRPRADQQSLPRDTNLADTWRIYDDWRRLGEWVSQHLPADAIVLTPRDQQTFKWYAQRAEVVSWKDVPQDAVGLIEWSARFQDVHQAAATANAERGTDLGLLVTTDDALTRLAQRYRATYCIVPRYQLYLREQYGFPARFARVYPRNENLSSWYVILKVGPEELDSPAN